MIKRILLVLAMAVLSRQAQAQGSLLKSAPYAKSHHYLIYGQVDQTGLYAFVPHRLYKAGEFLSTQKLREAASVFKSEALQHDEALGTYVGWIQADEAIWPQEITRQKARLQENPKNDRAMFKLGVVLFYQWVKQKPEDSETQMARQLEQARSLMTKAWEQGRSPLAGLFLSEMAWVPTYKPDVRWNITEKIISQLIGAQAFAYYQEAKKKYWRLSPPSVEGLSRENLITLLAVVNNLRSCNDIRTTRAIYENGKLMRTVEDITERQVNDLHAYADQWREAILKIVNKK